MQRELLAGLDEHTHTAIDRYVIDSFRTGAFTESDYVRCVVRAVTALGERGSAVIVGRGSPYIMEARRNLRVLVVAPLTYRAQQLVRADGVSETEAEQRLAKLDAERREFLGLFGVNPDDPVLYDLVINTASLGLEGACDHVVQALSVPSG